MTHKVGIKFKGDDGKTRKIKPITGYICPVCNQVWASALAAATCHGPSIETCAAYKCQCTLVYKTIKGAMNCTHTVDLENDKNA